MTQAAQPTRPSAGKPACLIVFKFRMHWHPHLVRKLSLVFHVTEAYIHPEFLKGGSGGVRRWLTRKVSEVQPDVILFDLDYYYLFDLCLIESVGGPVRKALICFDDLVLHRINALNAAACDLVLSADPLSVLKYRELGMEAEFFCLEASRQVYIEGAAEKDIDVLHFGSLKADRREFIDYLASKGMAVRLVGPETGYITQDELVAYIGRSRIVLNFAKTDFAETTDLGVQQTHRYFLQFKGRVVEAGLCRAACVSEYSPALRLLFSESEVPSFSTPEQCHVILKRLLGDDAERIRIADRLHKRTMREYEDGAQIRSIAAALAPKGACKRLPVAIPVWYWRLATRHKIRALARSPTLVLLELQYLWVATDALGTARRLILIIETCFWIPWHYLSRVKARVVTMAIR